MTLPPDFASRIEQRLPIAARSEHMQRGALGKGTTVVPAAGIRTPYGRSEPGNRPDAASREAEASAVRLIGGS